MRARSTLALVLVCAALWLCPAVTGRAMLLPLPRDAARLAPAAPADADAEAEYDAVAGAAAANWPDDEPPPPGLSQEEQARLLRMLLRMMHERDRADHDAAVDAALAAAGPLLEPGEGADDADADAEDALPYGGPHAPDDKRNLQGMMPTLCHFKICHMGRKRNQQKAVARAAH